MEEKISRSLKSHLLDVKTPFLRQEQQRSWAIPSSVVIAAEESGQPRATVVREDDAQSDEGSKGSSRGMWLLLEDGSPHADSTIGCFRGSSIHEQSAPDQEPGLDGTENGTSDTDEAYHEILPGHRAGDAELVVQSFPAGMKTPPVEVLLRNTNPEFLSFGYSELDEPMATNTLAAGRSILDMQLESEPESDTEPGPEPELGYADSKNLKRKALQELACRKKRKS